MVKLDKNRQEMTDVDLIRFKTESVLLSPFLFVLKIKQEKLRECYQLAVLSLLSLMKLFHQIIIPLELHRRDY